MSEQGFSGTKAATIVGITYRQLDYWARTDLIRPSLTDAAGSGSRRLYSYRDLLELRVIKSLLDVPVLYGGSVKPDNAAELLSESDVDGALVGGASLDVESFTAICQAAASLS